MRKYHTKNTIRYFILVAIFFVFLFFTNDFGLIDIQKTAIILAAGIDRDEEGFIVTSQVAIPNPSEQGKSTNTVQIVSHGKTVADAFGDINAKTGWYPKLVFCNLIILGEDTVEQNVFDALDYFLLDEYLSDNCLVATCEGKATDILNTTALVEDSSSAAIEKILSPHAERVGTVLTATLRTFSMLYYDNNACGMLPVVKLKNQQEPSTKESQPTQPAQNGQNQQSNQSSQSSGGKNANQKEMPVFSAEETALFKNGKRVGTLTAEETFTTNALLRKLRLASYSVTTQNIPCTLTIKQNAPKLKFKVSKKGIATLQIDLTLTVGLLDYAKALPVDEIKDMGDVPAGAFSAAQKKLAGEISALFEKTRALDCDLFRLRDRFRKMGNVNYTKYEGDLLKNTVLEINVRFQNVR